MNYSVWRGNSLLESIVLDDYLSLSTSYIAIDKQYAALVGKFNTLTPSRSAIMIEKRQKKVPLLKKEARPTL